MLASKKVQLFNIYHSIFLIVDFIQKRKGKKEDLVYLKLKQTKIYLTSEILIVDETNYLIKMERV